VRKAFVVFGQSLRQLMRSFRQLMLVAQTMICGANPWL